ncbi:CWC22-like protein, partial [Mya arenaria]
VFKPDPNFQESEEKYAILKKEILGEAGSDDEDEEGSGSGDSDSEAGSSEQEECAHKLLKMELRPGQEVELCYMILDCCAQMRTYEKFYGLLAGRFCMIDKKYVTPFQAMFREQTLLEYYAGLMPRDNPRDTRFAINFFTTIGLGGLTDDLRDHLKNVSMKLMAQKQEQQAAAAIAVDSSDNRKNRDKANGKHGNVMMDGGRKGGKSKGKQRVNSEEVIQREREDKFRKLAKLANYGDIESIRPHADDGAKLKKSGKEKRDKKKLRKDKNDVRDAFDDDVGLDVDFGREKVRGKKDKIRGERNLDNSRGSEKELGFVEKRAKRQSSVDSKDDFDARNYANDVPRDDRRRNRPPKYRDERDGGGLSSGREGRGFSSGGSGREDRGAGREKRRGKKQREIDPVELEREEAIRVERTFERLDMYEDKFERERQRNLDILRHRDEFQDFFSGREEDLPPSGRYGGRERDGRDYRGGKGDMGDRYDSRAPPTIPPPLLDDRGRGPRGERGEDRGLVVKDERRRRR